MFDADISKINLSCPKTWSLISSGNTKGCFQLESRLGRVMAKKLKPSNIEQLSALISIIRPGCLEAIRDGKSVTNHYIDKKNGEEPTDYFHHSLEPILKTTYGEMVYQEQAMEIARVVAGFNLQEADLLRKAIGKKKPEEMAKLKNTFLDGSKKVGLLNFDQAEEIFNWIEKSQRYSFNKSHAISYALNCYLSAYAKAHYSKVFFASYLRFAKDKVDPHAEIKELVQNATEMGIEVDKPDVRLLNEFFELYNNKIYFGLTDIKGFGKSAHTKLMDLLKNKNIKDFTWINFLCLLFKINSTASKALIQSGALDYLGYTRNKMLFEYNVFSQLTNKEYEFIANSTNNNQSLLDNLQNLLNNGKVTSKRIDAIQQLCHSLISPPYSLDDSIEWIADTEHMLLGCSISCSKIDMYDISNVSCSCKEFKSGYNNKNNIILAGEIENIRVVKTKKGKDVGAEMAFVAINDNTAVLDSVVYFPETYKKYRNQLFAGNVVIIKGTRSKNKDGLVVEKTYIPKP